MLSIHTDPFDDAWVAFDLETTGLNADRGDAIIEIGAAKFQGGKTLDTFERFVNPQRRISPFITALTGIQQRELDRADTIDRVAPEFVAFVGTAPLIAHNAGFDLGFLRNSGIELPNPIVDTYDLAYVLRPDEPSYALEQLAQNLELPNIRKQRKQDRAHRAVYDAIVSKMLFLSLLEDAAALDPMTLAAMQRIAQSSGWSMSYLLDGIAANPRVISGGYPPLTSSAIAESSDASIQDANSDEDESKVGLNGLDMQRITRRLHSGGALKENERITPIDADMVASMFSEGGELSRALDGFESRAEQVQMAQAVTEAINDGERIIIEAGTGVGKSLAYLLPAALYALANGKRVVISTNTINLQEQLLNKDVPILVEALKFADDDGEEDEDGLRFASLKGRANYLCMRRWNAMYASEPTSEEARLLAKTMLWLQSTASGDRAEINLGHRDAAAPWDRLSANNARGCMRNESVCFLRAARERAAASHLIVVNHALLLSNALVGRIIPDYDVLIIDEAHHLEEEATKHLGFELTQARFGEHFQNLSGDAGLPNQATMAFRTALSDVTDRKETVDTVVDEIARLMPRVRDYVPRTLAQMGTMVKPTDSGRQQPAYAQQVRVTKGMRANPKWSEIEIGWENADLALLELGKLLGNLHKALEGMDEAGLLNYESLMNDLADAAQANDTLRRNLHEFVVAPEDDAIYWLTLSAQRQDLSLHAAPLHVAEHLDDLIFSQTRSVIMTSATLSTEQNFNHIVERTGFKDARALLLGSPFDYPNVAALCLPNDIPAPNSWAYQDALDNTIKDTAIAADGRTMALFTSYSALRKTASNIRNDLKARGIEVLQQGNDGPPAQIVRRFMQNPRAVLLGTASFWEGVDLPGDALSALIIAKLPFDVPNEPVFQARSELYDNAFMQYSVPRAILRLRQGFGRLIRTKTDRGVVVILDGRVTGSRYGSAFLRSLPPARQVKCSLHEIPAVVRKQLHG
ncbi:MAG: DEAD/DEAH box helicase [Chloroflexi bacterium]|nr:DEAD/DEAH box helicase [Chloroflexota bacterium]